MNSIDFQEIYNLVESTLPSNWSRIAVCCVRIEDSFDIKYFVKTDDNKYVDCFNLDVPTEIVINALMKVCTLFSSNTDGWKSVTILINSNGDFNAEADYLNSEVNNTNYIDNWKKKYLV